MPTTRVVAGGLAIDMTAGYRDLRLKLEVRLQMRAPYARAFDSLEETFVVRSITKPNTTKKLKQLNNFEACTYNQQNVQGGLNYVQLPGLSFCRDSSSK